MDDAVGLFWVPGFSFEISEPATDRNTVHASHFFANSWAGEAPDDDAGIEGQSDAAMQWNANRKAVASAAADACAAGHNNQCFCPQPWWDLKRISRSDACSSLRGKTLLFTGSSILRDMWNALSIWLLQEDRIDMLNAYVVIALPGALDHQFVDRKVHSYLLLVA